MCCTHETFAGLALENPSFPRAEDHVMELLMAAGRGRVALGAAGAAVGLGTVARRRVARQHPG